LRIGRIRISAQSSHLPLHRRQVGGHTARAGLKSSKGES
jgi:hypothetical protein